MDLKLNDDQIALQEAFTNFFAKVAGSETVRAAEPLGFDQGVWSQLVRSGVPTMAVPEALGGGGSSFFDLVIVAQEFGKRLAPVPLVESVVGANILTGAGASEDLVAGLVDGSILSTVALDPVSAGVARLVPAGAVAEVVVALDGTDLVALRRGRGPRPHVESPDNLGSSPLADWRLEDPDVERHVLATGQEAIRLHTRALVEWQLLMAGALDGLRTAALDIGVDYVKARRAFGVPVGSFQAVQHRLADVAVAGEGAQLLLYEAAWAYDVGEAEADRLASMAFLYETEVARQTTRESLQFHGGYGYTLEYDVQLYFRRARAWPMPLGDLRRGYLRLCQDMFGQTNSGRR